QLVILRQHLGLSRYAVRNRHDIDVVIAVRKCGHVCQARAVRGPLRLDLDRDTAGQRARRAVAKVEQPQVDFFIGLGRVGDPVPTWYIIAPIRRCRMNRSFLVLSLLLSGAGVWLLRAQVNTSAIAGIVTDESGSVAPNVEVTAVQEATGLTRKTRTNETGEYVLPQLPPGRYQVTAEAAGFQKTLIRDVTLAIAQRERIDIALKVGQV